MSYFQKNLDTIIGYTQSHFELVFLAVFISLILWVPIGIMMTRNDKAALSIMGIANSIFVFPVIFIAVLW